MAAVLAAPPSLGFLAGGGGTAERIAAFDWSATPLGPIEMWPAELKSALSLVLAAPVPALLLWGEQLTAVPNDELALLLGRRDLFGLSLAGLCGSRESGLHSVVRDVLAGTVGTIDLGRDFRPTDALDAKRWRFCYSPVRLADGTLGGAFGMLRKALEGHPHEVNDNESGILARIVETTDAFVQAADLDFRWLAINKASADEFERIFGVRPAVGLSMLDLLADRPDHQAAVKAVWGRALAGEEFTEIGEFGDAERRWYEMKYNTLRDAAGNRIGAFQIVTDVTDRVRAQRELAEAEEALRQSQKMEAIGRLTGGIAHDFNNLLQIVTGNLEVLQRKLSGEDARLARLVDNAMKGAARAAALSQRLLTFARRGPAAARPIRVNALLAGMSDLIHQAVGQGVEIVTNLAEGLGIIEADPSQVENAIINLVVNARDAMPQGGRITIGTARERLSQPAGGGAPPLEDDFVVISIADTGHGMDSDTVSHIFEPFFTTKSPEKGTGLGLAMVYGCMQQAGGHIRVESQPGRGTEVRLCFPLREGPAIEEVVELSDSVPTSLGRETLLVVEDNDDVRQHMVETLRELGYRILEAHDGPSALSLFARHPDSVDLLFCDIGLPGLNGDKLAVAARRIKPGVKVLFTSGSLRAGSVEEADEDDLVAKPFSRSQLAIRVRQALDRAGEISC